MIDTVRIGLMLGSVPLGQLEHADVDCNVDRVGKQRWLGKFEHGSIDVREMELGGPFSLAVEASVPKWGGDWRSVPPAAVSSWATSSDEAIGIGGRLVGAGRVRRIDLVTDFEGLDGSVLRSVAGSIAARNAVVSRHESATGTTITVRNRSGAATLYDKGLESNLGLSVLRFESRERSTGWLKESSRLDIADIEQSTDTLVELREKRFIWAGFDNLSTTSDSINKLLESDRPANERIQAIAYLAMLERGQDPRHYFDSSRVSRMKSSAGGQRFSARLAGLSLSVNEGAWEFSA